MLSLPAVRLRALHERSWFPCHGRVNRGFHDSIYRPRVCLAAKKAGRRAGKDRSSQHLLQQKENESDWTQEDIEAAPSGDDELSWTLGWEAGSSDDEDGPLSRQRAQDWDVGSSDEEFATGGPAWGQGWGVRSAGSGDEVQAFGNGGELDPSSAPRSTPATPGPSPPAAWSPPRPRRHMDAATAALLTATQARWLERVRREENDDGGAGGAGPATAAPPNPERQRGARRGSLRIVAGSRAGLRLWSSRGELTRPMMGLVRGAAFDMIGALLGAPGGLPPAARWLDLFAGTGAVGLEALSRGAAAAEFVEADAWTARAVLHRNLHAAGVDAAAGRVHVCRVEDFLARAKARGVAAPLAFDFVSVCPPYELVDYPEVFGLLTDSGLLHKESIVLVEYPHRLRHLMPDQLASLVRLRNRRYGRTFLLIYGPPQLVG